MESKTMNIVEALEINAEKQPLHEALLYENRQYNYLQFNESVNRLANGLLEHGVKKGDHAAMLMKNSDYFAITYFALAKIGAVIVPINFRLLANELSYIIDNSDSKHVIIEAEFEKEILKAVDQNKAVKNLISVPETTNKAFKSYQDILSTNTQNPGTKILGTDHCHMLYTSGTTGNPKGALFDHKAVRSVVIQYIASLGYHPKERWLHFAPFFHAAQLAVCLLPQFYVGGFGVIYREFNPKLILKDISKYNITAVLGVPTMYKAFLQVSKEDDFDFTSIEKMIYGAAPMSGSDVSRAIDFFGTNKFYSLCGQTETGPAALMLYPEDHKEHAGIGKSGKGTTMFTLFDIVNPEGKSVEVGEVGEIIMKVPSQLKEYYKNPEATANTIIDGYVYSGDLAVRDGDGYIQLVDRNKDMIISGGENVYSIEVENTLSAHPEVLEAAVIGTPDAKWGEVVTAIVATDADSLLTEEALIAFVKENLASYKAPKKVIFVDSLPRNTSGKLLKYQLRKTYDPSIA
ncbi:class I adenylate-forming enzyme family protein [Neobacillus niacini]|uniref:class I adenylate-forming enzyme family protein n=1 Tax=Neobacillus niacini TaxID=86668 RepID=UPI0027D7E581|nr:long-chain-fatty-acid--CoA ligase [Neobacillus niacini]